MSALPPKADIGSTFQDVRFVPKADIAVVKSVELIVQTDAHDVVGCCLRYPLIRSDSSSQVEPR
jgi:hypothetical protein